MKKKAPDVTLSEGKVSLGASKKEARTHAISVYNIPAKFQTGKVDTLINVLKRYSVYWLY